MRFYIILLAFVILPLTACMQNTKDAPTTAPQPAKAKPIKHTMHGIEITLHYCTFIEQTIDCRFTALSQNRLRTLNLMGGSTTKIYDDTGASYPVSLAFGANAKDKAQRSAKLSADIPYHFSIRADNVSKDATTAQMIDIKKMEVSGVGAVQFINMTFTNPPVRKHSTVVDEAQRGEHTIGNSEISITQTPYEYTFARIEAVNEGIRFDHNIRDLWFRGAYLHLRPDGALGHNWSKPGPYVYVPEQGWYIKDDKLVIVLEKNKISYTFDISQYQVPMVTYMDQGGIFKMTLHKKDKGEK